MASVGRANPLGVFCGRGRSGPVIPTVGDLAAYRHDAKSAGRTGPALRYRSAVKTPAAIRPCNAWRCSICDCVPAVRGSTVQRWFVSRPGRGCGKRCRMPLRREKGLTVKETKRKGTGQSSKRETRPLSHGSLERCPIWQGFAPPGFRLPHSRSRGGATVMALTALPALTALRRQYSPMRWP